MFIFFKEVDVYSVNDGNSTSSGTNVAAIVGATVGAIFVFVIILVIICLCCKCCREIDDEEEVEVITTTVYK